MDIAAFIIAGFLIGFAVGVVYTLAMTRPLLDVSRAAAERWHRQAMKYLEALTEKNKPRESRDGDDADWWKK